MAEAVAVTLRKGLSGAAAPLFLLVALTTPAGAQGKGCEKEGTSIFSGYRAYEENDSIIKDGGDERYTQGLRLEIAYRRGRTPCWTRRVDGWLTKLWPAQAWSDGDFALVLGQNLYTPRIITSVTIDPNDRSFSDFTYLGAQFSITSKDQNLRHTLDVDFGALGRPALGKGAQGGLHTLKMDRVPKGWDSTQPTGIGANAYYRVEKRLSRKDGRLWPPCLKAGTADENCIFDFTFGHTAELGNVRTSIGLHGTFRVGWRLSGFPALAIQSGADRVTTHRLEVGAIAGFEGRAIAYTALVHGTPGSQGFSASRAVLDQRYGAYARYSAFRFTFQHVKRSHEFSIPGVTGHSQAFGSISASYEPSLADMPTVKPWLLRNWQFELGMGANFGGPEIAVGNDHGLGSQLVARKGLIERGAWKLNLGLMELAAATVETSATPGEPGNRSDLFLQQRAVTLGLSWTPNNAKYGLFGLRAGSALWSGAAQIETVFHQPEGGRTGEQKVFRDFKAPRGGWLVGAQYFPPLERHVSVGVDVAYHDVRLGEPVPDLIKSTFWKAILAVQIRP